MGDRGTREQGFALSPDRIRRALKSLQVREPRISDWVAKVGVPKLDPKPAEFRTLVQALTAQQLSDKAAATIFGRVEAHFSGDLDPARVARVRLTTLRKLGLSERKAASLQGLARSVTKGELDVPNLIHASDEDVVMQIAAHKGFGVWSGQMFLIFSLGRPDVWPTGDLGVQKGMQRILELEERPTPKVLEGLGERFAPHRSALALLTWRVAAAR